jgi:acyl-CoA thioesterase YciA
MKLVTTNICKTSNIGVQNNLFGGTMMSWLDEAGAVFAIWELRTSAIVTLRLDTVLFTSPVHVHDIVTVYGETVKFGTTSITIKLKAIANEHEGGRNSRVVCETQMVFVHIDENGKATPHGHSN